MVDSEKTAVDVPAKVPVETFKIDANVLRQLGDQLITDAEQALLELIKNSYDADAGTVNVEISTDYQPEVWARPEPPPVGCVKVTDTGVGMNLETIRNGWLMVSHSPKLAMRKVKGKTKKDRAPLGEKGLGRLSTMKLGDYVEIVTHTSPVESGYRVFISWKDFVPGIAVDAIPVNVDSVPADGSTGTTISVLGIDVKYWNAERRAKHLQVKFSSLVSPFGEISGFKVKVGVNGKAVRLADIGTKFRETATTRFDVKWDDQTLLCTGRIKLDLFNTEKDEKSFDDFAADDGGEELARFLANENWASGISLRRSTRPWFLEFSSSWTWPELANKRHGDVQYDKPGPFEGELTTYDLDGVTAAQKKIFPKFDDYKDYVKDQARVSIFRDGFGVRMADDWLKLGKAWTSGKSYYGLKPSNTLGFVSISTYGNPKLTEKSDREGFIDSPASRGFAEVMATFVKFANDSLSRLRRGYNDYRTAKLNDAADLPNDWSPADAAEKLREIAKGARKKQEQIKGADQRHQATISKASGSLEAVLGDKKLPGSVRTAVRRSLADLESARREWQKERKELERVVEGFSEQEKLASAVVERFEQLQRRGDEVYDVVSVGLSARALAHDIHPLLEDLLSRTRRVSKAKDLSPAVLGYLEAVKATVNLLRKQLAFLDPLLPAAREVPQELRVAEFVRDYFSLRAERLRALGITFVMHDETDFDVKINRGRLLQVVDNVVRNSEYWLRQQMSNGVDRPAEIHALVSMPFLTLWDTGPGVKPSLERSLFDLGETDKPKGEGSGLGLFIAKELLSREKCGVRLDRERNAEGRRYKFVIDLEGVINGNRSDD